MKEPLTYLEDDGTIDSKFTSALDLKASQGVVSNLDLHPSCAASRRRLTRGLLGKPIDTKGAKTEASHPTLNSTHKYSPVPDLNQSTMLAAHAAITFSPFEMQ